MRYMEDSYGIIFIDSNELIVRIYEVGNDEWTLQQYFCKNLSAEKSHAPLTPLIIINAIIDIFTSPHGEKVIEWKMCGRGIHEKVLNETSEAIGIPIEDLTPMREQELICKGMFTELW
jgi:hypothetical protein